MGRYLETMLPTKKRELFTSSRFLLCCVRWRYLTEN